MGLRQVPYTSVVQALVNLKCRAIDLPYAVVVCRGSTKLVTIRKISPVTRSAQSMFLAVLELDMADYLRELDSLSC